MASNVSDLMAQAKCFLCLTPKQLQVVNTYLLAVGAGASTDPKVLLAQAKCFSCLTTGEHLMVQTFLYDKIANG